jgi:hypothetical protein
MHGELRLKIDNIIGCMRFACWITKATDTHLEYVILIAFRGKDGYANTPQCCVIHTLPLLFTATLNYKLLPMMQHRITSTIHVCLIVNKSCLLRKKMALYFTEN